jgi:arylsulfatase A-like enzyme
MDWTATILAAGGAKADPAYPLDGIDLMPAIKQTRNLKPETRNLFWRTSIQDAALHGRWKYMRDGQTEYLFDLSVDEREQANFREQNPAVFKQLKEEFTKWDSTVLARPAPRRRA